MIGAIASTTQLIKARLIVPSLIRAVRHCASVGSGAFALYRHQKPQDPLGWWLGESPLPQTTLRAIDKNWLTATTRESFSNSLPMTKIETRERIGVSSIFPLKNRTTLQIPGCVYPGLSGEYGAAKLVPGALVNFKYNVNGVVMHLNGVVRSVSRLCAVRLIALHDYRPGFPAAEQPPLQARDGPLQAMQGQDLFVAPGDISTGSPEVGVHRSIPLATSSLQAHPFPAQTAEVLIDGEIAREKDPDFWKTVFSPSIVELGPVAKAAGLVRSRADLRLDGEVFPVLLAAQQANGSAW